MLAQHNNSESYKDEKRSISPKKIDRRWWWLLLGFIALIIRFIAPASMIESIYSRGIFIGIRWVFSQLSNLVPIALVYFLFLGLVVWLLYLCFRKKKIYHSFGQRLIQFTFSLLAFISGVIFFFFFLWGYNYQRIPLEDQVGLEVKPLSLEDLRRELERTTSLITAKRFAISGITDSAIAAAQLPANLEDTIQELLHQSLAQLNYPVPASVKARSMWPKGLLLRISTAGVYIPFTGEGHIDGGLHPLQIPFVSAHEMSHGFGFGDEGTCNFLAYLALIESDNPLLVYVGHFSYWRYVASNYRRYDREGYKLFYDEKVPAGVKNDLIAIHTEMNKYPDILPRLRDAMYNNYLKAQGIKEGIQNYSRILMLEKARQKQLEKVFLGM